MRTETSVGLFILIALAIFFYMTFHIGVFRLDRTDHVPYIVYFEDVSGLQKKADVKIAGVKVGWVESIELLQEEDMRAKAHIMVNQRYQLHSDAHALVRQDGLLGSKYLEVVPGDPLLPSLGSGAPLGKPGKPAVNVDDLLRKFRNIATNVEDITGSLKGAIGGTEKDQLKTMVSNFSNAANNLASFAQTLERTMMHNEQNLNMMLHDFKDFARDLRSGWPSIQHSVEQVSEAVDRDLNRVATKFESTSGAIEDAALHARDGMRNFSDITGKINEGRGLLGKLVTEDETYQDIKIAVQGLKNYFAKVEQLGLVVDAHSESMWGIGENFQDHLYDDVDKKDAKGYVGVRIHPAEDHFYILQAVASRKGYVERFTTQKRVSRAVGFAPGMCPSDPFVVDVASTATVVRIVPPLCEETTIQHRDGKLKLNLQVAKVFDDVALRFGLFENTAGVGIDYDIPFRNDNFRWVTSLEAFDFYGDNRINDQRPHIKWLNRLFILKNFYMTFGADDVISKKNANAFFGMGVRFGDDDLKYIVSRFGTPSMG